jgi:starch synthase
MKKYRVLFVSQEITPYLPETEMSLISRHLPQGIQEKEKEIRTFMPRYGCINERRHQLHEVIRLSGMNLIIDDTDHPLIIKVASIQPARMQVYFIDNEEYFQRKATFSEPLTNKPFPDNDERSIFFCRGVIETVKKLGWSPDIIHCHGWFTAPLGLYLKKAFSDNPLFSEAKVVYSVYNDDFKGTLNKNFSNKLIYDGITDKDVKVVQEPTFANVTRLGIQYADAVIAGSKNLSADVQALLKRTNKPVLGYQSEDTYINAYSDFYEEILEEDSVYAE